MEFKSINKLKSLLDENKISVKEIAQSYIKKIKEKKDLNIFIYFDEDKINNQVTEIEKLPNNKKLKGIPIAVKDLFCTKNMPTTAASKILENFNIEITDNRVNLKIDLSDEDIEFLKIHPENYTIINFYSELLLILRFIRNKEANTIGR